MRDSISSGVSLCIVTCGVVVIAANIWPFGLGGPVFILATLLNLNDNLTGARGGGINWNLVLSPGKGCTTLGGALRGSTGTSWTASVNSSCRVSLLHFQQVVSYRLVTGHTYIPWRHLVLYLFGWEGRVFLGFSLAGF